MVLVCNRSAVRLSVHVSGKWRTSSPAMAVALIALKINEGAGVSEVAVFLAKQG